MSEVRVRKARPMTPGTRHRVSVHFPVAPNNPHRGLTSGKTKKTNGRNNQGRITTRHRGGGHKRKYRLIDWQRSDKDHIVATVKSIEHDPNRTASIALLCYSDGEWRYIVAPKGLKAGDKIQSGPKAPIEAGNCLPMANIPVGTTIHNIEMKPGKGAQMARSAGASAMLVAREAGYAILRLRSGEMRKVPEQCRATIGVVSNSEHSLRKLGKAGVSRHLGRRPTVRGVAMNPVDHPHGGGEGRTSGGRHPVSPSGKPTKGARTRSNKRTDNMIIRRRHNRKKS